VSIVLWKALFQSPKQGF